MENSVRDGGWCMKIKLICGCCVNFRVSINGYVPGASEVGFYRCSGMNGNEKKKDTF